MANVFQEALTSEAQDISTTSIPYDDLKSTSRHPTAQSQPIVLGFSLPPYYLSCTASSKVVVDVFCQLVSFVRDHEACDKYTTGRSISMNHALVEVCDSSSISSFHAYLNPKTFRVLERRWAEDGHINQDLLRSLGPSMCAELIKVGFYRSICIPGNTPLGSIGIVSGTPHRLL